MQITINGTECACTKGETILAVARRNGISIPTLCYHPAIEPYSVCRLCIVEVFDGRRTRLVTACSYPITRDGLEVRTDTERVRRDRRLILELLMARAPGSEEVKRLAAEYGLAKTRFATRRPDELCILCGLCERACQLASTGVITRAFRGVDRRMTTAFDKPPEQCTGCLACAFVCPTGAIEATAVGQYVTVAPWGAEVELATCSVCGRPFAPKPAIARATEALGMEPEYLAVCFDCRREGHGRDVGRLLLMLAEKPTGSGPEKGPRP